MGKMKIEMKNREKNIAAMRRLDNYAGECERCYYYIKEKRKTLTEKKKSADGREIRVPKENIVVLEKYCSNYKDKAETVRKSCTGCWIYEHE